VAPPCERTNVAPLTGVLGFFPLANSSGQDKQGKPLVVLAGLNTVEVSGKPVGRADLHGPMPKQTARPVLPDPLKSNGLGGERALFGE
jgi:hypothetical protein